MQLCPSPHPLSCFRCRDEQRVSHHSELIGIMFIKLCARAPRGSSELNSERIGWNINSTCISWSSVCRATDIRLKSGTRDGNRLCICSGWCENLVSSHTRSMCCSVTAKKDRWRSPFLDKLAFCEPALLWFTSARNPFLSCNFATRQKAPNTICLWWCIQQ